MTTDARTVRRRVCLVVTTPYVVNGFLMDHVNAMAQFLDVTLISNFDAFPLSDRIDPAVARQHVPLARRPAPLRDARAIARLAALFRALRPHGVITMTPKAGLAGLIAARITGVPLRLHLLTGQVWATRSGPARWSFKALDRAIMTLATDLIADSASQVRFLEREGLVRPGAVKVIGAGSVAGVDLARFRADPARRRSVRQRFGLTEEAPCFLFLGRIVREKGIPELLQAFEDVRRERPGAALMLVGPDEDGLLAPMTNRPGVIAPGPTLAPEEFIDAADVLVLPSHREGFGTVVIEAAAMGVPAIGTRIYGLTDAIIDGQTGLLVPPRDPAALTDAMVRLTESGLRGRLGAAAAQRSRERFDSRVVVGQWMAHLRGLLDTRCANVPQR